MFAPLNFLIKINSYRFLGLYDSHLHALHESITVKPWLLIRLYLKKCGRISYINPGLFMGIFSRSVTKYIKAHIYYYCYLSILCNCYNTNYVWGVETHVCMSSISYISSIYEN